MTSLDNKLMKIDTVIERFNNNKGYSFRNKAEKIWDFWYITDVAGSLIRRYQKPRAKDLGWSEKKLTFINAALWGIGGSLVLSGLNYLIGDYLGENFQEHFYNYPEVTIAQNMVRIAYSQTTGKSIGALSIYNLGGTSVYLLRDFGRFLSGRLRKFRQKKPVEGVEPSTYSSSGFL